MGLRYLWDTNTVIYYFNRNFPQSGEILIDKLLIDNKPAISIITEIELLCWNALKEQDMFILKQFISGSVIYELNESIKLKTIEIRKHYKLKLPDAIIAASALVNNHVLISRNASDFKKIEGLTLLDPFNLNQ